MDPATVTVDFSRPDADSFESPGEQAKSDAIRSRESRRANPIFILVFIRVLQVPDDLSFDEEYDKLGDVDRMIGQPFEVL